jgi:hypothetical protein
MITRVLYTGKCSNRAGIILLLKDDYLQYHNPYPAVTADNGRISAVFVRIGLKSLLSCIVGSFDLLVLFCKRSYTIGSIVPIRASKIISLDTFLYIICK